MNPWERLKAWLAGDSGGGLSAFRFEFGLPVGHALAWALLALLAALVAFTYWPRVSRLGRGARVLVVALRAGAFTVALFLLLDPCIVAKRVEPGDQYAAILFDDSKSMTISNADGVSRADSLRAAYQRAGEEFERKLGQKYRLVRYRFGENIAPLKSPSDLKFDERDTDIVGAIDSAKRDIQGARIGAVVLFSDGVQQSEKRPAATTAGLDKSVPIFTVACDPPPPEGGAPVPWRDLELSNLTVTKSNVDQSPVTVIAPVRESGLDGEDAVVEVMLNDRVVESQTVHFTPETREREVRFEFIPAQAGWLDYQIRARLADAEPPPAAAGESSAMITTADKGKDRVPQNNIRRFVVDNRRKTRQILYLCGRPNWENKFVKRALEDDEELKLTTLIRMSKAQKKFVFRGKASGAITNPLFQGFDDNEAQRIRYDEAVFVRIGGGQGPNLDKGYPTAPEDLFRYDLVIWGDIERDFFSQQHMELTRDYVRKRGGAFLMLGGRSSLAEGRYDGSIIEEMLPVTLGPPPAKGIDAPRMAAKFKMEPTVDGVLAGAWTMTPDPRANAKLWAGLPDLTGLNQTEITRPGATVMARAQSPDQSLNAEPLFATQRFGEGRTAILATETLWQYHLDPKVDPNFYARFWRQLIRGLVDQVPAASLLRGKADQYTVGKPADLELLIRDGLFDEREGLKTTVAVTAPGGVQLQSPVEESIQNAGVYKTEFTPSAPGLHFVTVEALNDKNEVVGKIEDAFLADEDRREFQKAQADNRFMGDLARETGGRMITLDQLSSLADMVPWEPNERSREVRAHLWRLPAFYFALVGALSAEWLIRRRRGYA